MREGIPATTRGPFPPKLARRAVRSIAALPRLIVHARLCIDENRVRVQAAAQLVKVGSRNGVPRGADARVYIQREVVCCYRSCTDRRRKQIL